MAAHHHGWDAWKLLEIFPLACRHIDEGWAINCRTSFRNMVQKLEINFLTKELPSKDIIFLTQGVLFLDLGYLFYSTLCSFLFMNFYFLYFKLKKIILITMLKFCVYDDHVDPKLFTIHNRLQIDCVDMY